MTIERVDYIAKTLAELIKLLDWDQGHTAMLVYLLNMAVAEADDLLRNAPRPADGGKSDRQATDNEPETGND